MAVAQWVEQLTCIQEVGGLNPGGKQFFSWKSLPLCIATHCCFLKLLLLMLYNTQMYIDGLPTTNAGSQKNSN